MATDTLETGIEMEPPADALPPGGGAVASEEEQVDAGEVRDGEGFNGKGKSQLTQAQRDKIMDLAEKHAREGTLPPRDEQGRFKLDDEEKPEPKAEQPEPEKEETPEPADSDEMRRARKALLRDGYEPEELTDWEPERIKSLGLKRAAFQAKQDKRFKELAKKAGEPTDRYEEEEEQTKSNDDAATAELASFLFGGTAPRQGEGSTDGLSEVLAGLTDDEQKAVRSALDRQGQVLTRAQELTVKAIQRSASLSLRTARTELAEQYPFLREPDKWETVLSELAGIDRDREILFGADQERVNALVKKASFSAFGEAIATQARTRAVAVNRNERASAPRAGNGPPSPSKQVSKERYMELAQQAASEHPGNLQAAKARLTELLKRG